MNKLEETTSSENKKIVFQIELRILLFSIVASVGLKNEKVLCDI